MLAKKTSKNQVTLPKKAYKDIPETDYFDVNGKRQGADTEAEKPWRRRVRASQRFAGKSKSSD